MSSLQDQFDKVRDNMRELPGLPGVYSPKANSSPVI